MALPPVLDDAVNATVALTFPAVAVTLVGALATSPITLSVIVLVLVKTVLPAFPALYVSV